MRATSRSLHRIAIRDAKLTCWGMEATPVSVLWQTHNTNTYMKYQTNACNAYQHTYKTPQGLYQTHRPDLSITYVVPLPSVRLHILCCSLACQQQIYPLLMCKTGPMGQTADLPGVSILAASRPAFCMPRLPMLAPIQSGLCTARPRKMISAKISSANQSHPSVLDQVLLNRVLNISAKWSQSDDLRKLFGVPRTGHICLSSLAGSGVDTSFT